MILLRIYLLTGLIVHKVVWELLKRSVATVDILRPRPSLIVRLVKAVKIAILLGIVLQTISPEIFPISSDPFALRVVGVVVFTSGLLIAILSRIHLGRNWSDIESAQVLNTQSVVSKGIYAYVRHPIYLGDILLLIGLQLCLNSWLVLAAALLAPVVFWKAVQEEKMLVNDLPGYRVYCAQTKRFIPFIV